MYTVPASTTARVVHISYQDTSGADKTVETYLNTGAPALYRTSTVPADEAFILTDELSPIGLAAGNSIAALDGVGASVNFFIFGYEKAA
jgi:hypothetical protein